jgi:hypothetical protein
MKLYAYSGSKSANSEDVKAKAACYSCRDSILVTEISTSVELQELLNHIAKRILIKQSDILLKFDNDNFKKLNLICNWSCDEPSGQSTFKQKFSDNDGIMTDENMISLVPLQMFYMHKTNRKNIVWNNTPHSSKRFCRNCGDNKSGNRICNRTEEKSSFILYLC